MDPFLISFLFSSLFFRSSLTPVAQPLATPAPIAVRTISRAGEFRSTQGVMDPLSCHCYNGGYITTKTGNRVATCFDTIAGDKTISCTNIRVTGTMKSDTIETSSQDVCPSGTETFLDVSSYSCIEG